MPERRRKGAAEKRSQVPKAEAKGSSLWWHPAYTVAALVLALLVWFGGPWIGFGEPARYPLDGDGTRLVIILGIVLLWGTGNLIVRRALVVAALIAAIVAALIVAIVAVDAILLRREDH